MRQVIYTPRILDSSACKFICGDQVNAWFHVFGSAYEEFENGPGNYTTAIIELEDGTVVEALPTEIQFRKEEGNG